MYTNTLSLGGAAAGEMSIHLDLYQCSADRIKNESRIREFIRQVCSLVPGNRFGDSAVIYLGSQRENQGYSIVQLFEDALLSGRFMQYSKAAHIDLLLTVAINTRELAEFCQKYFRATKCVVKRVQR